MPGYPLLQPGTAFHTLEILDMWMPHETWIDYNKRLDILNFSKVDLNSLFNFEKFKRRQKKLEQVSNLIFRVICVLEFSRIRRHLNFKWWTLGCKLWPVHVVTIPFDLSLCILPNLISLVQEPALPTPSVPGIRREDTICSTFIRFMQAF